MPTYVYACDTCDREFEKFQSFKDEPLSSCPACASSVRRVFQPVGIVFKGSGWYITDSRKNSSATADDSAGKSEPATKSEPASKNEPADKSDSAGKSEPATKSDSASKSEPTGKSEPVSKSEPAATTKSNSASKSPTI